jgi:uncharacterized membrane protein (UPF0127 family)
MAWNKIIVILCLSLTLGACTIRRDEPEIKYLELGANKITVELARTQLAHYRGLSGRDKLCDDCGMLFVFPEPRKTAFVMRDMKFPLDMIGIREGKVVAIDENVQPENDTDLTVYQNKEVVDYVLEVNAGTVRRLVIKVGDKVDFRY